MDEGPSLAAGQWLLGEADPVPLSCGQPGYGGEWGRFGLCLLRFLQANPLEVNYSSAFLKGKIPVIIHRMFYGEGWEEEGREEAGWGGAQIGVEKSWQELPCSSKCSEYPPAARPENLTWEGLYRILARLKEASRGLVDY